MSLTIGFWDGLSPKVGGGLFYVAGTRFCTAQPRSTKGRTKCGPFLRNRSKPHTEQKCGVAENFIQKRKPQPVEQYFA
jgi:hypothetical protein